MDRYLLSARVRKGAINLARVDELYPSVEIQNPEFLSKVKESIMEDGLINPIVIMSLTVREWKDMRELNSRLLPSPDLDDDEYVWQVRCGNNRLRAATELGYTFIETIIVRSLDEASSICKYQREF